MIAAASSSDDGSDSGRGASGGGASIEPETARALQDALRAYLLTADASAVAAAEAALVAAFRTLATEARTHRISAERIVILIKSLWYELPELRTAHLTRQQGVLAQAVTLWIRAYYADAESR